MVWAKRLWGVSLLAMLCFLSAGFSLAFTASQGEPRHDRPWSGGWDREGAARYLDARMDVWFTKAKSSRRARRKRCASPVTRPSLT
jgi:hypothetical protein